MYQELKKFAKEQKYFHLHRIESGNTFAGIPDIYYTLDERCGWIELKQTEKKPDGSIVIPYRPGQQNWLNYHISLQTYAFVLLYFEKKYYLIYRNFRKSKFTTENELFFSCCWIGEKFNNDFLTGLEIKKETTKFHL